MSYAIHLPHRGKTVIEGFDLFDEAQYGADKLFFRGHFCCPDEIKKQILTVLGSEEFVDKAELEKEYGITDLKYAGAGNPLAKSSVTVGKVDDVPTIAMNRYYIPDKKFWENTVPKDIMNPYKARYAVWFRIKTCFYNDSGYIDFGVPWSSVMDEKTGVMITDTISDMSMFSLLSCYLVSIPDALEILKTIVGDVVVTNTENYRNSIDVLVDDSGEILDLN